MSEQAEDRITNLPDPLLHYVLSFLDIKEVARTSVLSKRWYYIWISIPTLDFRSLCDPYDYEESSELTYQESNIFMNIVDRILHLHDMSSIQKLFLHWNYPLDESRVNLWISAAIRRNVEELSLTLNVNSTFSTPLSLCTCESLVTLELDIFPNHYLPKYMSFPKLKHFKLSRVIFSDKYNNEQLFSGCPVLENLTLEKCEWFDMKKFCLSTPSLKVLKICSLDDFYKKYGLENCAFEIHTPSLVSLTYRADVAKEYVMSNFLTLAEVDVQFGFKDNDSTKVRINQGARFGKFLGAVSHVKCLKISDRTFQDLPFTLDLKNNLPTFHNLRKLNMTNIAINFKALIALLQSAPHLESLLLCWAGASDVYRSTVPGKEGVSAEEVHLIRTRCMFLHLKSVYVSFFTGHPSEAMLLKLILEQATALETMTFTYPNPDAKVIMEDLISLPRASASCVFNFP